MHMRHDLSSYTTATKWRDGKVGHVRYDQRPDDFRCGVDDDVHNGDDI